MKLSQGLVGVSALALLGACNSTALIVPANLPAPAPVGPPVPANRPPAVASVTLNPDPATNPGMPVTVLANATDPDGDALQYTWTATGGRLSSTVGQAVTWTPPDQAGGYSVAVTALDGRGGTASGAARVDVRGPAVAPASGSAPSAVPDAIKVEPDGAAIDVGEQVELHAAKLPAGTGSFGPGSLAWGTSDERVAKLVNTGIGVATFMGVGPGTAAIWVRSTGTQVSYSGRAKLIVTPGGTSIQQPPPRPSAVPSATPPSPSPLVGELMAGQRDPGFADGKAGEAQFQNPTAIVLDRDGNLLIGDNANKAIRKVTPDGTVTTIGRTASWVQDVAIAPDGTIFAPSIPEIVVLPAGGNAQALTPYDAVEGFAHAVAIDPKGTCYAVTSNAVGGKSENTIWRCDRAGRFTAIAGDGVVGQADGVGPAARFNHPTALAAGPKGELYVADTDRIRLIRFDGAGTATVSTLFKSDQVVDADGQRSVVHVHPWRLTVDGAGDLYWAGYDGIFRYTKAGWFRYIPLTPAAQALAIAPDRTIFYLSGNQVYETKMLDR